MMEDVAEEEGLNNNYEDSTSARQLLYEVALRLPFLFCMDDALFVSSLNSSEPLIDTGQEMEVSSLAEDSVQEATQSQTVRLLNHIFNLICILKPYVFKSFIIQALIFFKSADIAYGYKWMLRHLILIYLIFGSYNLSKYTITSKIFVETFQFADYLTDSVLFKLASTIVIQGSVGVLLDVFLPRVEHLHPVPFVTGAHLAWLRQLILPALSLPTFLCLAGLPERYLDVINYVSVAPAAIIVLLIWIQVLLGFNVLVHGIGAPDWNMVENLGLFHFLEVVWNRARIPQVLRAYFALRCIMVVFQSQSRLCLFTGEEWDWDCGYSNLRLLLVRSCENYLALLALTSFISAVCAGINYIFQWILQSTSEVKPFGSVSAILFFILALQTGLPDLEEDKRFHQLAKNGCLLLTAIFHQIHFLLDPVLVSLASSTNNKNRHVRALAVCLFLCLFPIALTVILWSKFSFGTWLLHVTIFCVEVVIKVLVTCLVYSLTMWDVYYQKGLWEPFDDWIFYINSFGNTVQFVFAIFLFLNGGWVLLFESGGTLRLVMMAIHAYFNIWLEAKSGWSIFWKRRMANAKVGSLRDATPEQILKHADICSICYQAMTQAKLTRCSHMFHNSCLTKWLYRQDSCPMCQEPLHKVDATSQTEEVPGNAQGPVL